MTAPYEDPEEPIPVTQGQLEALRAALQASPSPVPLSTRFRALFTLRALRSSEAVEIVGETLTKPGCAGALLGHELAYVLGQMGRKEVLSWLETALRDERLHPMVRHEAAEAMGAISSEDSLPILREYLHDTSVSVRETCELAIRKIEFDHSPSSAAALLVAKGESADFSSVDPAPGMPQSMHDTSLEKPPMTTTMEDVLRMKNVLLDREKSLWERYRAMFGLRNLAGAEGTEAMGDEAIEALAEGFTDSSALFRHEIAYIFGQLSHPASVPSLLKVLRNRSEDEMVRHEAAEALGSIATAEVLPALQEFSSSGEKSAVVRESCEVALDMYEYENSGTLHYTVLHEMLPDGHQRVPN